MFLYQVAKAYQVQKTYQVQKNISGAKKCICLLPQEEREGFFMNERCRGGALLPIGVFLVLFLGMGILSGDFYSMPAVVGFLIALLVAFMQYPKETKFNEKLSVIAKGVGDENIITMCLVFLAAGGFSGAVTAAGGAESTVNFCLSVMPSSVAVVGLMVIGSFISLSMGTSMGTIGALSTIAVGISEKTGISMALCIGAVVCGAMFGDNLSMISYTTIAAVRTQGCEMKDKFKANFFIVLPAAIVSLILFGILTGGQTYTAQIGPYNIWQILPYVLVLVGALIGFNVFVVLIGGTLAACIVGVATGSMAVSDIFSAIGSGVTGMYDITVISIIVACIVSLVKHHGGINFILKFIHKRIHGQKGAKFGIAVLSLLVDMATANNTVAIVIAGPIAKEISEEYQIPPKTTASLLDIFTAVGQGMIPYGAQLLLAAEATGVAPFHIMPYLFYPMLMAVSALIYIFVKKERVIYGK